MLSPKSIVKKCFTYFQGVLEEMRKISWPNRKTTVRYSLLVLGVSISVAVFFGILDAIFGLGLEGLIKLSN